MMSIARLDFVQSLFLDYYEKCFSQVCIPLSFKEREFGALLFKERIMIRHKQFKTAEDLHGFLCSVAPSDVYYSSAYYERPDASDMNAKSWVGADLVFDIDADHLQTPCGKLHDEWACVECRFKGRGLTPEECPACGGRRFEESTWVCEDCLVTAKDEAVKLLRILMEDFGFSESEVKVFFSGHRGYHVHVESEAVKTLDAFARKEIVDYVCGLGFDVSVHGRKGKDDALLRALKGHGLSSSALWARIVRHVQSFIASATLDDYKRIGLKRNVAQTIINGRRAPLKGLTEGGPEFVVKGVGSETWKRLLDFCVKSQAAQIDTVVTTDIHRLIRLAGSLHGKTGLKKLEIPISDIESSDPLCNAVAFKGGSMAIFVSKAPQFMLGGETYGPYENCKAELPTAAAVLLLCKGKAEVVE